MLAPLWPLSAPPVLPFGRVAFMRPSQRLLIERQRITDAALFERRWHLALRFAHRLI